MSKANKAKKLIPKTAKDCKISEEMTEDIINFYYSELRKKMESLDKIRRFNLTTEVRDKQEKLLKKIQKKDEEKKQRYKDLGK